MSEVNNMSEKIEDNPSSFLSPSSPTLEEEKAEEKAEEQKEEKAEEKEEIHKEFHHIIKDFVRDILVVFPERKDTLDTNLKVVVCEENNFAEALTQVHNHCRKIFPERFFDILYQNEEIFKKDSDINVEFLPQLDFKELWYEGISDKTRETIWKYLQLILFSIVNNLSNEESFGDTARLFEAINEDEFKGKLEDTINQMQNLFSEENMGSDSSGINLENLPNPENIHEHITGMLDGKLGNLAREIAEETANDLNTNMKDVNSVNDVFQKLFKNPGKLMDLVKNVGSKLDAKIKSGEIKESELLEEASEIMNKMKKMPGMGNLQSMFGKMAGGAGGGGMGGGKVNMGAMQTQINNNLRRAKMREKLQARQAARQKEQAEQAEQEAQSQAQSQAALNSLLANPNITVKESADGSVEELVYKTGETAEKSKRKNNKKKKKKKRGKN